MITIQLTLLMTTLTSYGLEHKQALAVHALVATGSTSCNDRLSVDSMGSMKTVDRLQARALTP
jgi:hypothetical protein